MTVAHDIRNEWVLTFKDSTGEYSFPIFAASFHKAALKAELHTKKCGAEIVSVVKVRFT